MIGGIASGVGGAFMTDKVRAAIEAKKAAQEAGVVEAPAGNAVIGGAGVQPHGDEAHTGGAAETMMAGAANEAATAKPKKKKLWGGLGGLFYKMPASGAKYNNSPINKNFGDAKARGFVEPPAKMSTFGVGSPESMSGVGADMEPPLELE